MNDCVNNFNPIIVAIATLMTVQVPAVITMLLNQHKMKHDIAISKTLSYGIDKKTDIQTVILRNGYHGHIGVTGEPGLPGPPGEIEPEESEPLPPF